LGKYEHVLSNPESLFVLDFLYVQNPSKIMSPKRISFFLERIFTIKTGRFVSLDIWNIDKNSLIESIKNHGYIRFIDLIKLVHLNSKFSLKKNNIRTIIDKNPPYTLHVEKLIKLDKKSKFVGIYRFYLDNIISRNKYRLDALNHPYYHALTWCKYNEELIRLKNNYEFKIHLVQYEKFVGNPEMHLSEIRSFLGIKNNEQTTDNSNLDELINGLKTKNEKEQFLEMHQKAFQDINNSSIGKTEAPFNSKQINAIHWICSTTSSKLGYNKLPHSKPNIAIQTQIKILKLILFFVELKHHLFYRSSHRTRKYLKFLLKPHSIIFNKS
ncbi:MAG: sulfotransferase, partial [Bacteroidetes bacterium]|nr:sulfotransferase [Bacteroidota bacterium]